MHIKTEIDTKFTYNTILHHVFYNFNKKLKKITIFLAIVLYWWWKIMEICLKSGWKIMEILFMFWKKFPYPMHKMEINVSKYCIQFLKTIKNVGRNFPTWNICFLVLRGFIVEMLVILPVFQGFYHFLLFGGNILCIISINIHINVLCADGQFFSQLVIELV